MPNSGDDDRWARAQAVLDKVDDEGARIQQRRIKKRVIVLLVSPVILLVLGIVLALFFVHPDKSASDENTASVAQGVVGLAVIVAGLAIGAVGLFKVQDKRTRRWSAFWSLPTAMLTRAQRKELTRQIRGKTPVDGQHLALSRDLAERIVRSRWLVLSLAGFILMQAGGLIQDPSWWRLAFLAVMVVLAVFSTISTLRFASQAQRFIAANPA